MVSMLASSTGDRGIDPWSGPTKDNTIGISWLAQNQNNVSKWH